MKIIANNYEYEPEINANYKLYAEAVKSEIISAIVSDDKIILKSFSNVGSSDVKVRVETIPDGTEDYKNFTVTVSDREVGRSSGGGGCSLGFGFAVAALAMIFKKK